MEEITFTDVLTHYQLKLKEVMDAVETIKNQLRKAQGNIDAGWSGEAADACRLKLETIHSEISRTTANISDALVKLSAIAEEVAEEETIVI